MLRIIKDKLNSNMGKDVIWTFSLQIVIMVCLFGTNKIISNRLSIDDFGQYNVIKRSVQVLSSIMLAGVGIALPRYIPLYKNNTPPRKIKPLLSASLIYVLAISLIVLLSCIIFSDQLHSIIIGKDNNLKLYHIALAYAFILALAQFLYAYYRGIGNFKIYNGVQLIIQIALVVPLIILPILTITKVFFYWGIITLTLVVIYLGKIIYDNSLLSFTRKELSATKSDLGTIVKYSSSRLVADFFLFSLSAFPLIYISNFGGLQHTAFFSVGITFITMTTPIFSFMGIILLPYVSKAIVSEKLEDAQVFIRKLAIIYFATAIVATIILSIFIQPLTTLFFASSYISASDGSRIMILSIIPQSIYLLYRNPIDAISVVPYNIVILGVCLASIVISFALSSTLTQFAFAYLAVSMLQGILSWLTWKILSSNYLKRR